MIQHTWCAVSASSQQERRCAERPETPTAAEHATPAKRAQDEGPSLAPAPELAAAMDAVSVTPRTERRMRRQLISSVTDDDGTAASASTAQSSSVLGAAAQSSGVAAGSETFTLETGREQPAAASVGQRRGRAASQASQPHRQPVTRSMTASRHLAARLSVVQDKSVAIGRCSENACTHPDEGNVTKETIRLAHHTCVNDLFIKDM